MCGKQGFRVSPETGGAGSPEISKGSWSSRLGGAQKEKLRSGRNRAFLLASVEGRLSGSKGIRCGVGYGGHDGSIWWGFAREPRRVCVRLRSSNCAGACGSKGGASRPSFQG